MPDREAVDVFDSPDLHVKFTDAGTAGTLFVTFGPRHGGKPVKSGFQEAFFEVHGLSALHFVARRNHWWQAADMEAAIAAARPILARHDQVTAYGVGMGGHGALVHSGALNADRVLALSPQFAINHRKAPWPADWAKETAHLTERFPMETGLSQTAEVVVVYDPLETVDAQHVREIAAVRDVHQLRTGFAGQGLVSTLEDLQLLAPLVLGVMQSGAAQGFVGRYRQARRGLLGAYLRAQRICKATGKAALGDRVGKRAQAIARDALFNGPPQSLADLLHATQLSGRTLTADQRLAFAARLVEVHPESSEAHMAHARALREHDRLDDAFRACSLARRAAKRNYNILLYRALIRAELGDIVGAQEEIEVCLEARSPARAKSWTSMVPLYRRAGVSERVLKQIEAFTSELSAPRAAPP